HSKVLAPIDEQEVWSITCMFVEKKQRRKGISAALIQAAAEYAASQGAQIVEGYPIETQEKSAPPVFIFTGLPSAFEQAGFVEVARRSPTRPIYRLVIK
ncbi:MAG TPA: GNAT family N-acetyltransferase, partial [Anaerolineales bacterium]|nr:GNAT family N-acetyltransferase [Anaerolineales bacterium]